jgi:hypothetical protein
MYRIKYTPAAKRDIMRLSLDVQDCVHDALDEIVDNPYEHVKKLKILLTLLFLLIELAYIELLCRFMILRSLIIFWNCEYLLLISLASSVITNEISFK